MSKKAKKTSKNTVHSKAKRMYSDNRTSGVNLTGTTGMAAGIGTTSVTAPSLPFKNPITIPGADGDSFTHVDGAIPPVISGNAQNEKYMWLNNAALQICPDIQRKLNPIRVSEILKNYSPMVANPIKVSYRDGKYYILDGMHTRAAMCGMNGTDNFPIFCRVYYGLSKEEEARLFATQFGISETVSMGYRLRALAVVKDPEVLEFIKVTENSGFAMMLSGDIVHGQGNAGQSAGI